MDEAFPTPAEIEAFLGRLWRRRERPRVLKVADGAWQLVFRSAPSVFVHLSKTGTPMLRFTNGQSLDEEPVADLPTVFEAERPAAKKEITPPSAKKEMAPWIHERTKEAVRHPDAAAPRFYLRARSAQRKRSTALTRANLDEPAFVQFVCHYLELIS